MPLLPVGIMARQDSMQGWQKIKFKDRNCGRSCTMSTRHSKLFSARGADRVFQLGIILMARDRMITMVNSEIVLSIIIIILARRVSGKASVGLKAVAVLYPR